MHIQPPRVAVNPSDPFKEALFNRKEFGAALTNLLRKVDESIVLFVHAPWGEGKTTFAEMWRASLKHQDKLDVVYFNAYATDYFEDPFVSFTGEILHLLENMEGVEVPRAELKKTAIDFAKRVGGLIAKVGVRAASMGAIDAAHLTELKDIASDVANGVSEIGAQVIEKKIENYGAEKDALKAFRSSLATVAKAYRDRHGFPLTIIVDELDRCRPDFALQLLERIKHLFDVDGIAFVLLVNRDQIESYIRTVYGATVDANAYLLKFGNLFVDLPVQGSPLIYTPGRRDYCESLFKHYGLPRRSDNTANLLSNTSVLVGHFGLTLREIEKVFAILALYYASMATGQFTNDFLVPLLAILKVKRPELFVGVREQKLDDEQFLEATGLRQLRKESQDRMSQEWVNDILSYCLMSDDNIAKLQAASTPGQPDRSGPLRMSQWLGGRYDIGRSTVIPLFCSQLDRFALTPDTR